MARKARREQLSPELTPLIDVVFLLLIFFLVSSVFKQEELALLLNLPVTEKGEQSKQAQKEQLSIELASAKIAINGKEIEFTDIESTVKNYDAKTNVILRVDGEVKYDRLVSVLDMLKKYKLENLSLITMKKN